MGEPNIYTCRSPGTTWSHSSKTYSPITNFCVTFSSKLSLCTQICLSPFPRNNGHRLLRRQEAQSSTNKSLVSGVAIQPLLDSHAFLVPKPGPDEVLVNIKYSGVCHTDLHAVNGDWPIPTKLPLVGGHEGAGVVVAKGDLVKEVEIGDHAGIKVYNTLSDTQEGSIDYNSG